MNRRWVDFTSDTVLFGTFSFSNITKKPKNMQLKGPVIMIYFMS